MIHQIEVLLVNRLAIKTAEIKYTLFYKEAKSTLNDEQA